MRIVDRKTFLALPGEVLFSKYEPCTFGPLTIRGEVWGHCNDFLTQSIADAVECNRSSDFACTLDDAQESGGSFAIDLDCMGRDGMFDDDQLFAIWEPADVAALIERLTPLVSNASMSRRG